MVVESLSVNETKTIERNKTLDFVIFYICNNTAAIKPSIIKWNRQMDSHIVWDDSCDNSTGSPQGRGRCLNKGKIQNLESWCYEKEILVHWSRFAFIVLKSVHKQFLYN